MSNIESTICELTKGEYWSNKQSFKEEFINRFYNGSHVLESVNMEACTQFFDKGSNAELLIYGDRKILYSCCYTEYYNQKIITHIYSSDGLEYRYGVDYDKLEKEFSKKKRK